VHVPRPVQWCAGPCNISDLEAANRSRQNRKSTGPRHLFVLPADISMRAARADRKSATVRSDSLGRCTQSRSIYPVFELRGVECLLLPQRTQRTQRTPACAPPLSLRREEVRPLDRCLPIVAGSRPPVKLSRRRRASQLSKRTKVVALVVLPRRVGRSVREPSRGSCSLENARRSVFTAVSWFFRAKTTNGSPP
jgi:hypothetical protein